MTDLFDRATAAEEEAREQALKEQRRRAALEAPEDWRRASAKWCEAPGCGVRIPDARRRALPGVRLCVDCAEDAERRRK